jgi:hypothetical protein
VVEEQLAYISRRHMTKAARAMAVAMIAPETHQGKKNTSAESAEAGGFSYRRLAQARTVLKWGAGARGRNSQRRDFHSTPRRIFAQR